FSRSISVPSGFSGSTQWVQLVTTSRGRTLNDNSTQTFSGSGLDTTYPYQATDSTEDSPGSIFSPCDFQSYSIDDSFTMWLMFQPVSANSIRVPLGSVRWSWSASAGRISTCGWLLTSSSHSSNPSDADSTTFPEWSSNVTNITWH